MVTLEEKLELQRLAMLIERLAEKIGELDEKIEDQGQRIDRLRTDVQPTIEFHKQLRTVGTLGKVGLYVSGALVALAVGITTLVKNWRW